MFYVNAKYLARRMKIEEFVVQQTTNWTFLKKKCQACSRVKFLLFFVFCLLYLRINLTMSQTILLVSLFLDMCVILINIDVQNTIAL